MELAIILTMLLIVMALGVTKLTAQEVNVPFKRKQNLFTPTERQFISLLETSVGHEFRILCRVRLSDVLSPSGSDKKGKVATAKAQTKQLDFILCEKETMRPVAAIDLVNSAEKYKTQRDWFVAGALESAHIAHIRIKVKAGYTPKEIHACIENKLVEYRQMTEKKPLVKTSTRPTRPLRSSRTNGPQAA